jgi:hypothetical protein
MSINHLFLINKKQGGSATLLVTVVLLALITLVSIYITKLGLLEVKTGANANRAKEALHHAQAGLDYGALMFLDQGTSFASASINVAGTTVNVLATTSGGLYTVSAAGESIDGTGAAEVQEGYGRFPLVAFGELPPLMSNGSFPPNGSFSIIGNPNGGGTGVPVSAWVASAATSGSWQTCNVDEWLNTQDPSDWDIKDVGTDDEFVICESCSCQQAAQVDGTGLCWAQDITNISECVDIVQQPTLPDVFYNTFGICVEYYDAGDASNPLCTLDPAEVDDDTKLVDPDGWESIKEVADIMTCAQVNAAGTNIGSTFHDAGRLPLVWVEGDCSIGDLASYEEPVILVAEGDITVNGNVTVFGILFAFTDIYPTAPATLNELKIVGSPQVYGVILTNADVNLPSGSFTIIYSQQILEKLSNAGDTEYYGIGRRAGSWTDFR